MVWENLSLVLKMRRGLLLVVLIGFTDLFACVLQ